MLKERVVSLINTKEENVEGGFFMKTRNLIVRKAQCKKGGLKEIFYDNLGVIVLVILFSLTIAGIGIKISDVNSELTGDENMIDTTITELKSDFGVDRD